MNAPLSKKFSALGFLLASRFSLFASRLLHYDLT
jgi:hypothetical protein